MRCTYSAWFLPVTSALGEYVTSQPCRNEAEDIANTQETKELAVIASNVAALIAKQMRSTSVVAHLIGRHA